jgi:hypothetical protein
MAMTPSTGFMTDVGGYGSILASKLDKIDCSQVLAAVLLADRELLGHIKMGPAAYNIQVDWIEDGLQPCTFQAQSAAVSTTMTFVTSFSSSTSVDNVIREGAILAPFKPPNGADFMTRVTSTNATTGIKIVTYGSTTWTTVDSTTTWLIVASPYKDVDDASSDISTERSKRHNFTQVFERAVGISQTRKNMSMEAVVDELQYQIKNRTLEIKRELDLSVIKGIAYHDGTNYTGDYNLRSMMGLYWYIRDPNLDKTLEDSTVTSLSAALTVAAINDLCYKIYGEGGFDETSDCIIVVGPKQQRVIAAMEKDIRRVEQGERQVGYYRDIFLSDMGKELPIVMDRWCPSDLLMVLDRSRMFLRPLAGDAWHMEKMAKTGRHEKWQISGQYTLEVRNAAQCHGMLVNLS